MNWPAHLSIANALRLLRAELALGGDADAGSAEAEARLLLATVCAVEPLQLVLQRHQILSPAQCRQLAAMLTRRQCGEPLQYIIGNAGFYDLLLEVGPGVLIPRPETERLVELALQLYRGNGPICDLCTGSGAVALALARHCQAAPVVGVDISAAALHYARRNRAKYKLDQVDFVQADLATALQCQPRFAMFTANPPYVTEHEYAELPHEVAGYEPRLALYAADQGMAVLRRVATDAYPRLLTHGWLLCEIGAGQGAASAALFRDSGYSKVAVQQDYCGRDRVVVGQKPCRN